MDLEKRARRQSLKIIISESIMVITVVLMVVILAFVASGYWVGADFKVERQGMLQISSIPTGASVEVDGDAPWFQRTNTSKVLSSGEHEIKLEKEGYDTWSKTINIREGLLYRIHYPRLFLTEREKSTTYDVSAANFITVSPDRTKMLLVGNTTEWTLLNLDSDTIEAKKIDISKLFSSVSLADDAKTGLFSGQIISANWSRGNDKILFKVSTETSTEWVLLAINNIKDSTNITREFATNFSSLDILDNSANNLLAIRNGNLHKIDVSSRQISAVLIENVLDYDYFGQEVVFSSIAKENITDTKTVDPGSNSDNVASPKYYIGVIKLGDAEPKKLGDFESAPQPFISHFYEDKYITVVLKDTIIVYKKDNFEEIFKSAINLTPTKTKIGHDGEFVAMIDDTKVATLDMESLSINDWSLDSAKYGWLDGDMLYSVNDNKLYVYDFDGLNRRELSSGVSSRFPVTITADKWLYYVSDGNLIREVINK